MAKYGMVIDITRCTACYCCFTACKDEYWDNDSSLFCSSTEAWPVLDEPGEEGGRNLSTYKGGLHACSLHAV